MRALRRLAVGAFVLAAVGSVLLVVGIDGDNQGLTQTGGSILPVAAVLLALVFLMRRDQGRRARGEPERSPAVLMLVSGLLCLVVGIVTLWRGLREGEASFTAGGVLLLVLTAVMVSSAARVARKDESP